MRSASFCFSFSATCRCSSLSLVSQSSSDCLVLFELLMIISFSASFRFKPLICRHQMPWHPCVLLVPFSIITFPKLFRRSSLYPIYCPAFMSFLRVEHSCNCLSSSAFRFVISAFSCDSNLNILLLFFSLRSKFPFDPLYGLANPLCSLRPLPTHAQLCHSFSLLFHSWSGSPASLLMEVENLTVGLEVMLACLMTMPVMKALVYVASTMPSGDVWWAARIVIVLWRPQWEVELRVRSWWYWYNVNWNYWWSTTGCTANGAACGASRLTNLTGCSANEVSSSGWLVVVRHIPFLDFEIVGDELQHFQESLEDLSVPVGFFHHDVPWHPQESFQRIFFRGFQNDHQVMQRKK